MVRALVGILAAFFACGPVRAAGEEWTATPSAGGFPMVEPFRASFRIGWTEIAAAEARAEVTSNSTVAALKAGGGTIGLARTLYQLDATLEAESALPDFETVGSEQLEKYRRRTLLTAVAGSGGNLRTKRGWTDGSETLEWKPVKIAPARDLFSAMMFIRSQPLAAGDKVGVVVFPGESPFFVEMESLGVRALPVGERKGLRSCSSCASAASTRKRGTRSSRTRNSARGGFGFPTTPTGFPCARRWKFSSGICLPKSHRSKKSRGSE